MAAPSSVPLLVMTAEPSGDRIAARVVESVDRIRPCRWFGIGGASLARAGVDILYPIDRLTAMGVGDVVRRLGRWAEAWAAIRQAAAERRPAVALLVDAPEVNLPLARILSDAGTRVVYYVGPQVWAWRRGRLGRMRSRVDVTALILPFEEPLYRAERIRAVFVGHPILDEPDPIPSGTVRERLGVAPGQKLVALLPGSRPGEIARHRGPMEKAGRALRNQGIAAVFAPPAKAAGAFEPVPGLQRLPAELHARDLLAAADAALVSSGTATLEAAWTRTPMAVVYRLDPLAWMAGRALVRVPWIGLPNWVAGRRIVPELLQESVTRDALVSAALALLEPREQARQRRELQAVGRALGSPGARDRVAALVLERLP